MANFRITILFMLLCLGMAACSPAPAAPPTGTPAPATPFPPDTTPSVDHLPARPPFLDSLQAALEKSLGLNPGAAELKSYRLVEWPDACLGLAKPDEVCAEVITPGYLIVFTTPKGTVELHTNGSGETYRQAASSADNRPQVAVWQRSGGIAGVCRRLTLYADGGYTRQDCISEKVMGQGQLSDTDLQRLKDLNGRYKSFQWKFIPPAGSADMFTDHLSFTGQGAQDATGPQQEQVVSFLSSLADRLGW